MPDYAILIGDAHETLKDLPSESVRCCVTSPPYWGLRDYGTARWEGAFAGSGTVGVVALQYNRDFIGIELNPKYADMAHKRIAEDQTPKKDTTRTAKVTIDSE